MSIPNWVPQSPKWFNLGAIEEDNNHHLLNICFKTQIFKIYILKETHIIPETQSTISLH